MSDDAESRARARVGSVLNEKWSLERLLGIGGMAAVYSARHRNGAQAAIKVLHADLSSNDDVRERFLREGYAANRVGHPGAVKVLDDDVIASGPDAGVAYLVMELLEGESLQDRLDRGPPVTEREFLAIAESVLDVLDAAHARGVVHRDLKPENLFLVKVSSSTSPGVDGPSTRARAGVKVLDFGLARLRGQAITSHGLALGTPSFMSPEQASGKVDAIDGRTDLFALAATGFRLRTGRRIHDGANAVELVTKMANIAAPRIRTVASDVSEPFARIIDRGLQFRREDRYESAAAMRTDVEGALGEIEAAVAITLLAGSPPPATVPRVAEPTIEVSARDIEPSPSPRHGSSRLAWRRGTVWSAVVVSLVVALTLATEVLLDPPSEPTSPGDAARGLPSANPSVAPSTATDGSAVPDAGDSPATTDGAGVALVPSPPSSAASSPRVVPPAAPSRRDPSPKAVPSKPPKPPPARPWRPSPPGPAPARGARPRR